MTEYALRLANGADTAARVRSGDALGLAGASALRARGGVRAGSGGAVTVVNGTMTVQVAPFMCWVDAAVAGQVGYPFVCDATKTLTIAAGHATLARTDVIAVVVREAAFDGGGTTAATLEVVQGTPGAGTPALPAAAIPLRNISVPAGTSAGTGGLTAANLGTDRRQYVVGLGGITPVASQSEQDALVIYNGLPAWRTDTKSLEVYNGGKWVQVATYDDTGTFPIYVTSDAANQPALATAWTAEVSNGIVQSFTAPKSGRVKITHGAYIFQNTAAKLQEFGYKISGGLTRDPLDTEVIKVYGVNALRASTSFILSGLTPGTSYTLTSAHRTTTAGSNPYMAFRSLLIEVV